MTPERDHLQQPVLAVARKDVATLRQDLTVQQALDVIRQRGIGGKIVYFYAVDEEDRLVGVLPTRRLLTAPLEQRLADLMIVWLWRGGGLAGFAIGGSILLALCAACFFGLSVPALLHALKLDPKISAGPVTLAFTSSPSCFTSAWPPCFCENQELVSELIRCLRPPRQFESPEWWVYSPLSCGKRQRFHALRRVTAD